MNHLDRIDRVISDLSKNGYKKEAEEIEACIRAASTGTELLVSSVSFLFRLKYSNSLVYNLIKVDTDELIKFCNSIGIEFHKR